MPAESLKAIFREIRAAGRGIEQPVRVAVVGPEGGFCYQSCLEAFGTTTPTIECATAADAFAEVSRGRAAYAIYPFESSAEGLVQSSLLALADTELVQVGERFAAATYHLMSLAADASALERVYLTAVAHAECQRFLDQELPRVSIIDVRSPRVAAELARESPTSGAVISERCGRVAGLEVLRSNIGDAADLRIRYGIAGQRPAARTGRDVSCLLFSTENQPGSLYDTLRHFAERGINLRRLQSLPARDGFEYYFYVEISGHASDRSVVTALEAIKRNVRYFRLLGSFPASD
jgi:chorismate mutase/prephenate dehydratase